MGEEDDLNSTNMSSMEDPSTNLDSDEEREMIRDNLIKNPAIFAAKAASPRKKNKEAESSDLSGCENPPEELDTETERDMIRQKLIDQPAIFAAKVGTLRKRRSSRKSSNNDDSDSSFDNPPTEYDTETEREMIRMGQRLNPSKFKVGQIRKRASIGGYGKNTTLLTSTPLTTGPHQETGHLTPIDQSTSPISSQDGLLAGNLCLTEKKDKKGGSQRKLKFPPSNNVLEDVDNSSYKTPSSISNLSAVFLRPRQLTTKSNLSNGFDSTSSISKSNATWNFKKGGKKSQATREILEEKEENEQINLELLKVTIDSIISAEGSIFVQPNQPSVDQMNSLGAINKPSNSQHKSIIKSSKESNESTEESNESTEKSNKSTEESNESAQESTEENESPLRKSQMSIQREKDISIPQLPVPSDIKDEISEQPDQPIICQKDQSLEINNTWSCLQSNNESTEESTDEDGMPSRESQMSEQIEKNIPIQPLPIEEKKKIEKSQRPSAKEKSIPSEVGSKTSEDDDGSPPLKSQISKKRKERKSINMPKSPLKKRSTKLQPQAVQRLKSQIECVVSFPKNDSSSSEIVDLHKTKEKRISHLTTSKKSLGGATSTNNNISTNSDNENMIETVFPAIPTAPKLTKSKSPVKEASMNMETNSKTHSLSSGSVAETLSNKNKTKRSLRKRPEIVFDNEVNISIQQLPIALDDGISEQPDQLFIGQKKSLEINNTLTSSQSNNESTEEKTDQYVRESQMSIQQKEKVISIQKLRGKNLVSELPVHPLVGTRTRSSKQIQESQIMSKQKEKDISIQPLPIALDDGISEQPDQLFIGQKKSLEINNTLTSSRSNNESTEEKTDQYVRESQMSIQQKEKVISIQRLRGKNLVSELPVHPLVGPRTRSSKQIQESQMSKQKEKDILIQVLPLETGEKIEKRQRNKAKENKIPSTQQTSEDDEGLPSLGSKIKKKIKKRKPINMPKSPIKNRSSNTLQPQAVQRLKSHIDSVISSLENNSSSKIVDVRKPRERKISQLTFPQKSFLTLGGASSTNNNIQSIFSVSENMIERPSSQGNQSIYQSIKDSSTLLSQQTRASVTSIIPVTPTALKSAKNKSPIKKVSMNTRTNSKNQSLNSEHISETLSQENMLEVFPESLIIPPKSKPYKRGLGSNLKVLAEEPQPKISKKVSKLGAKCKGMKCGPPPCSRLCPRWKGDANVLLNSSLLSKKMLKETAQQLGQKLTPAETQKLLSSINPYLENMFDELCEETPLAFGVWGFQAFKEKCKTKGFFKGKDVSDVELTNKLRNQLKDEETKTAAAGILYPKSHSKDTLSNFDRA